LAAKALRANGLDDVVLFFMSPVFARPFGVFMFSLLAWFCLVALTPPQ